MMVTIVRLELRDPDEEIELKRADFQIGCFTRGDESVVAIALQTAPDDAPSPGTSYFAAMMEDWGDVASVIGSLLGAATQAFGPPDVAMLVPLLGANTPPTEH